MPTWTAARERIVRAPAWLKAGVPAAVVLGAVIGTYAGSVPRLLTPAAGPPDTLSASGLPVPRATPTIRTPYLRRAIERPSAREIEIDALAVRYGITRTFSRMIYEAAEEEGIDPELGFRLIRVESVFDRKAIGSAGALGLTQLMPGTARDIDPKVRTRSEIMEPRTNLRLGFTNLRNMLERYDGDVRRGVLAYNRGEVAVDRALRRGRDPENGYSLLVLGARAHGGKPYRGKGLRPRKPAPQDTATAGAGGAR